MITAVAPPVVDLGTAVAAKVGAGANGANEAQDRFLKLLVAQLTNQDPTNPMDNAQMTSQIAQINTVTGIQQLNETMKGMAAQATASQMLSASSLVGHRVLVPGDRLSIEADGSGTGALELSAPASNVQIEVRTAGGRLIDTLTLGSFAAGQHGFSVDTSAYPADTQLHFAVIAANGSVPVESTALMRDQVVAIGSNADGLLLTLLNSGSKPYSGVRAIL
ncbi:MAG: flagellar hook capping FlgD N-terminal domain-containing protein [Variovorax sp.]